VDKKCTCQGRKVNSVFLSRRRGRRGTLENGPGMHLLPQNPFPSPLKSTLPRSPGISGLPPSLLTFFRSPLIRTMCIYLLSTHVSQSGSSTNFSTVQTDSGKVTASFKTLTIKMTGDTDPMSHSQQSSVENNSLTYAHTPIHHFLRAGFSEHIAPTSASFRMPSHQYINGETGVIDFEISASNCSIHIGGAPFSTILFDPTISCNSRS